MSCCQTCLFHNLLYTQRVLITHIGFCYTAQGPSPLCSWPLQVYFPGCWTNRHGLEGKFSLEPTAATIYVIQKAKGAEQKQFFPMLQVRDQKLREENKAWTQQHKEPQNKGAYKTSSSQMSREVGTKISLFLVALQLQEFRNPHSSTHRSSCLCVLGHLFLVRQIQEGAGRKWSQMLFPSPLRSDSEVPAMGICYSHCVRRQLQNALKTLFGRNTHKRFDFKQ